jgi:hypothetical protein
VSNEDLKLAEAIRECRDNPLRFVQLAYPWGEPGPLREFDGPDTWQRDILQDIGRAVEERNFDGRHAVAPLRYATSSGHGIGKSTLVVVGCQLDHEH